MNNESMFIAQKTVLRAENESITELNAFVMRLIIPMNTGSAPSVIFIIGRNLIRPSLVLSLSSARPAFLIYNLLFTIYASV